MESLRELYRIGYGPSSSHTMGPFRASEMFLEDCSDGEYYTAHLYGSLALTGKGHFTDKAIEKCFKEHGRDVHVEFHPDKSLPLHPNALTIIAYDKNDAIINKQTYYSVGGGKVVKDGESFEGEDVYGEEFSSMAKILAYCEKEGISLWELPIQKEGMEIFHYMGEVWDAMCDCIQRGLDDEGVLPGGLKLSKKAARYYALASSFSSTLSAEGLCMSYAYAVSEQNAQLGKVVTAPTCGSCGVLPATLYYLQKQHSFPKAKIQRALLTAGVIGNVIKMNGSISGAEVGCQGEVGSACAMAGAAATGLLGGSIYQVEYAAEMGLEHHLGLTCDPMLGLVQVPCIERNALAALRALDHTTLAILSDGRHMVSLDDVIGVMMETGKSLPSMFRETALGGLAALRTVSKI